MVSQIVIGHTYQAEEPHDPNKPGQKERRTVLALTGNLPYKVTYCSDLNPHKQSRVTCSTRRFFSWAGKDVTVA